jgi:hypothetical protein
MSAASHGRDARAFRPSMAFTAIGPPSVAEPDFPPRASLSQASKKERSFMTLQTKLIGHIAIILVFASSLSI